MVAEKRLTIGVGVVVILSATLFTTLLIRYGRMATAHVVQLCNQQIQFISSHIHFDKPGILFLSLLVIGIFSVTLAVIAVIKIIISRLRIKRLNQSLLASNPTQLSTAMASLSIPKSQVVLIGHPKLFAFVSGFRSSKLYLSTTLLKSMSAKELEAVLLHESYHFKHKHIHLLAIYRITRSLLFFIPLVGSLVDQIKLSFEQAADAYTIGVQGTDKYLKSSLVYALKYGTSHEGGINFANDILSNRVATLTGERNRGLVSKKIFLGSILLYLLAILMLVTSPSKTIASVDVDDVTCLEVENNIDIQSQLHLIDEYSSSSFIKIPASFTYSSTK